MLDEQLRSLIESYRPNQRAVDVVRKARLLLLVGISGAGKDSLKRRLLQHDGFYDFVSYTTRQPRLNNGVLERDGVDYNFVSKEEAAAMLERGDFIEAKQYSGNVYGTAVNELLASITEATTAVNDVEVQGVDEYKAIATTVRAVFVLPPSYQEWYRRLSSRYEGGTVDPTEMKLRVETAVKELQFALDKNYFHFIVNDDLDSAVDELISFANGQYDGDIKQVEALTKAKELLQDISTHLERVPE